VPLLAKSESKRKNMFLKEKRTKKKEKKENGIKK